MEEEVKKGFDELQCHCEQILSLVVKLKGLLEVESPTTGSDLGFKPFGVEP